MRKVLGVDMESSGLAALGDMPGVAEHRSTNPKSFASEGAQVLELASKARHIFDKQPPRSKRKLLQFVVSNSTWENGKLSVEYRQPFDLFASWSETMKKRNASEGA